MNPVQMPCATTSKDRSAVFANQVSREMDVLAPVIFLNNNTVK